MGSVRMERSTHNSVGSSAVASNSIVVSSSSSSSSSRDRRSYADTPVCLRKYEALVVSKASRVLLLLLLLLLLPLLPLLLHTTPRVVRRTRRHKAVTAGLARALVQVQRAAQVHRRVQVPVYRLLLQLQHQHRHPHRHRQPLPCVRQVSPSTVNILAWPRLLGAPWVCL